MPSRVHEHPRTKEKEELSVAFHRAVLRMNRALSSCLPSVTSHPGRHARNGALGELVGRSKPAERDYFFSSFFSSAFFSSFFSSFLSFFFASLESVLGAAAGGSAATAGMDSERIIGTIRSSLEVMGSCS